MHIGIYINNENMHAITLPGIRSKISSNPRFKSLYYKMRYKYLSR